MSSPSTLLTVSQLTFAIKNQLESRFLDLSVQGEITNFKPHSSGHLYFDLKDREAKISAVLFRGSQKGLIRLPKEGDQVVIRGSLSVYAPQGRYQLIVKELQFAGIGELLLKLEALKKSLQERGWFDREKKKSLPKFPKRIGIVTSPTGAVIRDIIHVLSRRFSGFQLLLSPVRVQGEGAALEIATAIEQLNRYKLADVIIVGRGGGSLEDLWAFNEEIVAKAIFESEIPIISAVGHETDVTIADFVADVRAPTPSAAAEIVTAEKKQCLDFLETMRQSLAHTLLHLVKRYRATFEKYLHHPLFAQSDGILAAPMQQLDDIREKFDEKILQQIQMRRYLLQGRQKEAFALKPTTQLRHMRQKLDTIASMLHPLKKSYLSLKKERLMQVVKQLQGLDPKNVLKRGYSILFAQNESSVIVSAQKLHIGDEIRALLSDGEINMIVKSTTEANS